MENLTVLLIIQRTANFPQVGVHGFLTKGAVLLSQEVLLVFGDVLQITLTGFHQQANRCEARTSVELVGARLGAANVGVLLAHIQTAAVRVLRCCYTVGTDEVITMVVTIFLLGFSQGAAYGLNTRRISYNCHK